MSNVSSCQVLYDRDSDVLYISTRQVPAARGVEEPSGVVWRYDREGELIGVTVVDFHDYWFNRRGVLAREISRRFDLPRPQVCVVLEHAMEQRN